MLITNDVALITFVPFTILVLSMADQRQALIPVIVLETIAANLGSMLTSWQSAESLSVYNFRSVSMGFYPDYAALFCCVWITAYPFSSDSSKSLFPGRQFFYSPNGIFRLFH